jgi:hypothetical protein
VRTGRQHNTGSVRGCRDVHGSLQIEGEVLAVLDANGAECVELSRALDLSKRLVSATDQSNGEHSTNDEVVCTNQSSNQASIEQASNQASKQALTTKSPSSKPCRLPSCVNTVVTSPAGVAVVRMFVTMALLSMQ